ncbi:MAG: hypothetical protein ACYCRH_02010 [Acidiferrobacteraceae bacterium]
MRYLGGIFLIMGLLYSLQASARNTVILKGSCCALSHTTPQFAGTPTTLGNHENNLYGIAVEQRHFNGVAYGVELLRSSVRWSSPADAGEISDQDLPFTVKQYHDYAPDLRPFVGVGAGLSHATLGGGIGAGSSLGLPLQLDGGLEWHSGGIGLYTEIEDMYAQPGTFFGKKVDLSGIGALAGLSLPVLRDQRCDRAHKPSRVAAARTFCPL